MKWVMLIAAVILGYMAYQYIVEDATTPKPTSVKGAAGVYIRAAMSGDHLKVEAISDDDAKDHNVQTAEELRQVLDSNSVLEWQKSKPQYGDDALQAVIQGKGRLLLIELKKVGDEYRVCHADLAVI